MSTPAAPPPIRASFPGIIYSEWIKIRGQRAPLWVLVLAVLIPALLSLAIGLNTTPEAGDPSAGTRAVVGAATSLTLFDLVFIILFGCLVASSEEDTRTITTTMAAVPRRWPVVLAKAAVVFALASLVGLIDMILGFFISAALIPTSAPVTLGDPGVPGALLGSALYVTCTALIAVCIAMVLRSAFAGFAGTVGFTTILPVILGLIPAAPVEALAQTFPGPVSASLSNITVPPGELPYPAAVAALVFWSLAWLGTATAVVRRRDI